MTYATLQDLTALCGEKELIQLTDRSDPPSNVVDEGVLGKALGDADAEIDAYIGARYALPLEVTPAIIVSVAADIARFRLWKDRASEQVRQRYDDAIGLLKRLSAGTARLEVAGVEAPIAGDTVLIDAPCRNFSRQSLRGF